MKNYFFKIGIIIVTSIAVFTACKKQETQVYFKSGTAPVLTSSIANNDTISLIPADSLNTAVTLLWTNPNYIFSDGISSQNVTYYIEIDTAGANFSSPNLQQISISSDLNASLTVTHLNTALGNGLQLIFGIPHTIQIRIESFLTPATSGSAPIQPLFSNAFTYVVTPYAPPPKITPPASGNLFIVGSATANGWNNPMTVDPTTQQFTKISNTEFKITLPLTGSGEYKWIGVNGSWAQQWSVATADTYPTGGPFVVNGANCIAPAASGTYTIDVNFQTGTFTVTQ